jgi:ABC-type bacteriocin/lantibiotic exporter with double-glycine peptidase domain
MMNIKVPFVRNQKKWKGKGWCGPIALASLLRYYNNKSSVEEIVKGAQTSKRKGKEANSGGTSPEGLVFFCLSKGFKVDYINKYSTFSYNRKEYSKRFRKFLEDYGAKKYYLNFIKKCEKFPDYKFIRKSPTLKDIENYIKQKKPVLLYLNIAVPSGVNKLWPHYVLVVGYDNKNFYVHNVYPKNQAYQKISKEVFAKTWSSDGMNDCLIIPYK